MKLFKRNKKEVLVEEEKGVRAIAEEDMTEEQRKIFYEFKKELSERTQMTELLKHLESGKTITSKEAFDRFGITRLSARIYDLRHKEGLNIITRNKIVNTRYGRKTMVAEYVLVRSKK